jgi:hypothetical protein
VTRQPIINPLSRRPAKKMPAHVAAWRRQGTNDNVDHIFGGRHAGSRRFSSKIISLAHRATPTRATPQWPQASRCNSAARFTCCNAPCCVIPKLARLRELMADEVTLARAWHENQPSDRPRGASTVEALMMGLRARHCGAGPRNRG